MCIKRNKGFGFEESSNLWDEKKIIRRNMKI